LIVYLESNFVLELALLQEQHSACEAMLELCERGSIRLVIPVFAMIEPYGALFRRRAERNSIKQALDGTLRELGRSAPLVQSVNEVKTSLRDLLVANSEEEFQRWKMGRSRLAGVAELIPLDESVFQGAIAAEARLDLAPPDAVIYASVHHHLSEARADQSCFINRNTTDFENPVLVAELQALGCKVLPAFDQGLNFLQGKFGRS
jgi:predicted nucleic acid-binding protein